MRRILVLLIAVLFIAQPSSAYAADVVKPKRVVRDNDQKISTPEAVCKASTTEAYPQVKNASADGDSVFCTIADGKGNDTAQHTGSISLECPENSTAKGDGCACDPGSKASGDQCIRTAQNEPPGKWAYVQRSKGEWLTVQSLVSGQKIKDLGQEDAMIQEYYLDGGEFDGYEPGYLFEVKGDYEGFGWMLAKSGKKKAAAEMKKKESDFKAQAKKLVETAAKYKLKPVYVVKVNQEAYWKGLLQTKYPTIEWRRWDRVSGQIVYPAP